MEGADVPIAPESSPIYTPGMSIPSPRETAGKGTVDPDWRRVSSACCDLQRLKRPSDAVWVGTMHHCQRREDRGRL